MAVREAKCSVSAATCNGAPCSTSRFTAPTRHWVRRQSTAPPAVWISGSSRTRARNVPDAPARATTTNRCSQSSSALLTDFCAAASAASLHWATTTAASGSKPVPVTVTSRPSADDTADTTGVASIDGDEAWAAPVPGTPIAAAHPLTAPAIPNARENLRILIRARLPARGQLTLRPDLGHNRRVVHLRVVAPSDTAGETLERLHAYESVINVVHLPGVARHPDGDLILCDVAREDASLVIADLRELGIEERGSIAIEPIDTSVSRAAEEAERRAKGEPSDAVVWETVSARTRDESTLSATFLAFMVLATVIASVGIYLNSAILIVGAMIVGPDFGPVAAVCVAIVERKPRLAARSFIALAVGFPLAIGITLLTALAFKAIGVTDFTSINHDLAQTIAHPGFFTFFIAFCAGIVGMLSLSTAKSGALIGVLVSVTTIPAAANLAVAIAYGDGGQARGSLIQLAVNVAMLLVAGTLTLVIQRAVFLRRRAAGAAADRRPVRR
jgi:uncharacterized hydrophobic protein (TIGR00271 family)